MTAISISEVTSGVIEGTGAFDKIMSAMQLRLENEFQEGRITGDDYANVYLGAMTAGMQQAVAYVLGKQTADTQAELTKAQTLNIQEDTINKVKQGLLLDAQTLDVQAETVNKEKQGLLLDAQKLEVQAKTANVTAETLLKPKQGLVLDRQAAELIATTNRVEAEELLIKHKYVNEQAQRADTVTEVSGGSVTVSGVIGKQKLLYQAQTDGFKRDAEQKLAKLMVDTWNVRRTTDSAVSASGTGLEDASIKAVVDKAKDGIGL